MIQFARALPLPLPLPLALALALALPPPLPLPLPLPLYPYAGDALRGGRHVQQRGSAREEQGIVVRSSTQK